MARPEKVGAVTEIKERFEGSEAAILTEYRGLQVGEIAEVRAALREIDADYKVLKNTLARIAVREVGLDELVGMLEGPTAIAFCRGDVAAAAKALDEAAGKFPVLVIKGGVLKGKIIDAGQARELAKLEPREVLLTKIAMLVNMPAQQTVNVFAALLRDFGSMLAQVVAKKESGELPGGSGAAPEPEAQADEGGTPAPAEPEAAGEPEEQAAEQGTAVPAEAQPEGAAEPQEPAAEQGTAAPAEAQPEGAAEPEAPTAEQGTAAAEAQPETAEPEAAAEPKGPEPEAETDAPAAPAPEPEAEVEVAKLPEAEEQAEAAPESDAAANEDVTQPTDES